MRHDCRWPTGTETLRVAKGFEQCGGKPSIRVGMATGSIVLSTHLWTDDAVKVAQALAVERAKLLPMGGVLQSVYPCGFFKGIQLKANPCEDGESIEVRLGPALAYLSKADAKALAMDLLAMTTDEA